ncbi:unnamed protein product [Rotaria sordida]|uniref:TIR domain-containing protein n=1 Tax=Rotaria sordida TaxID=392033 RepID=A0A819HB75_9BILA|nr:unnamed protein product [Rotaria sordida]
MSHCRILAENINSDQFDLQRAAEGLLWKLEREDEAVAKPIILNSYQYDIMISYSHKDKELCLQIHEQLVKDGFNVWVDRDCLRGSTMVGIANAIENSEYVLICMSNTYKESVYCQSEAHYAFERGCRLVPIMLESNYKPDGWLVPYIIHFYSDLPNYITEWTHDHVKLFFLRMELSDTILPLCTRVDGHRLLRLYEMCLINPESMYQSLKFELGERHHILLPIADYLTFLHEVKLYVPSTSTNVATARSSSLDSSICNAM